MTNGEVAFVAPEKFYGDVAEPKAATDCLPKWYTDLPMGRSDPDSDLTVRDCMGFMDALTMGFILPAPTDIDISVTTGGNVEYDGGGYGKEPLGGHPKEQLGGDRHPEMPKPIVKFEMPWSVVAPDGVSVLVTPPLNRPEKRFTTFSGVVDVDDYAGPINAPAIWHEVPFDGTVNEGEPVAQIIPFDREGVISDATVRPATDGEEEGAVRNRNPDDGPYTGYRQSVWNPKDGPTINRR